MILVFNEALNNHLKCMKFFIFSICLTCAFYLSSDRCSDTLKASLHGNLEVIKEIYYQEGHKALQIFDGDKNTLLHLAAFQKTSEDKIELIKFFIEKGLNPNIKNIHDSTPLFIAVSNAHINGVKALLESDLLQVNQKSLGFSPLHIAVLQNHEEITKILLNDPRIQPNSTTEDGATPLHFAAMMGLERITEHLLQHPKISINAEQYDTIYPGATPLHFAALQGHVSIVNSLLKQKHPPVNHMIYSGEYQGFTPLHFAVLNPDTENVLEIIQSLLACGANPNIRAKNGKKPRDLTNIKAVKTRLSMR